MSIEINGINKYFGRTKVLNDISLDIASGEMVALLGRPVPARPRCCASSPGWKARAAASWVSTAPTSATCTRATDVSASCFSTMRCSAT